VRSVALLLIAGVVFGASGAAGGVPQVEQARELALGIVDDISAVANSFAGGPDDPHSPIVDRVALNQDAARLQAATDKANRLASELPRLGDTANASGAHGR
jgi:hypothetical protein